MVFFSQGYPSHDHIESEFADGPLSSLSLFPDSGPFVKPGSERNEHQAKDFNDV
jgi:hypothetical protein